MSHRKKNVTATNVNFQNNPTIGQTRYTAEELSQIIATAIVEAEQRKKKQAEKEKAKQLRDWEKMTGISPNDAKHKDGLLQDMLYVLRVVKLSFTKRKVVEGTLYLEQFPVTTLQILFTLLEGVLVGFSALLPFYPVVKFFADGTSINTFWITYIALGFLLFVVSRIVKIMCDELYVAKDANLIFSFFSCFVSLLSFLVAVAAFVKGL